MNEKKDRYSTGTGYLLLGLSVFGLAGLHRFYLGKYGTGLLWLFTWGFFGIGTFVDILRMPAMVRESNLRLRYHEALFEDSEPARRIEAPRPESVEHAILSVARRNKGPVSASEVALETGASIDDAKKHLDKLVEKGYAELRVRKSGQLVYVVPDFLDASASSQFEDL